MNEKIPIPCQACKASGLRDGMACNECGGKGYRMIIGGQLAAVLLKEGRGHGRLNKIFERIGAPVLAARITARGSIRGALPSAC